jgi:uncharacterized HAD superfamily protein
MVKIMKYMVDIDGTICSKLPEQHYSESIPYLDRINQLNQLYEQGHQIIYWTARGMSTGIDYYELTKEQLHKWGCKYTRFAMGKPSYDVWIDDKAKWIFD